MLMWVSIRNTVGVQLSNFHIRTEYRTGMDSSRGFGEPSCSGFSILPEWNKWCISLGAWIFHDSFLANRCCRPVIRILSIWSRVAEHKDRWMEPRFCGGNLLILSPVECHRTARGSCMRLMQPAWLTANEQNRLCPLLSGVLTSGITCRRERWTAQTCNQHPTSVCFIVLKANIRGSLHSFA